MASRIDLPPQDRICLAAARSQMIRGLVKQVLMWLHGHCSLPDRLVTAVIRLLGLEHA